MDRYALPADKAELGAALYRAVKYAQKDRNRFNVIWQATRFFLRGLRGNMMPDWNAGRLRIDYNSYWPDGIVYEEALGARQSEIASLMQVGLKSVVKARGMGLDSIRKGAIGHSTLQYHTSSMDYPGAARRFATNMVDYGTAAITYTLMPNMPKNADHTATWRAKYEDVPPWELLGIPAEASGIRNPNLTIARERWVPLPWLKEFAKSPNVGLRPKITFPDDESKLTPLMIPFGAPLWSATRGSQVESVFQSEVSRFLTNAPPTDLKPLKNDQKCPHVQFVEWFFTQDGIHLDAYLITSRAEVLGKRDYWEEGIETWYPMGIGRYCDIGGFYGRAWAEPRINLNRITEHLLEQTVRVVDQVDTLGAVFYQRGLGILDADLRTPTEGGGKWIGYDPPDMMSEKGQPFFQAQPATPGTLPSQVLQLVSGLEEKVMPQYSIFSPSAPRRADSQGSLQYIDNAANQPRSPAADSMADAWITMYRSMLDSQRRFYGNTGVVPITQFSDNIVGVVYDPKLGGITLEKNAIPSPDEVEVTTESRAPRDPELIAQSLQQELLQSRTITPSEYRIFMRLYGVDNRPMGSEAEWQAWQMAQMNIIMAYGDGQTPGEVKDPMAGPVAIHIMALIAFMAGPRYALASQAVMKQFTTMLTNYQAKRGDFSQGAPYPEDAATMENARQKMMMRQQAQQGGNGQRGAPIGGMADALQAAMG